MFKKNYYYINLNFINNFIKILTLLYYKNLNLQNSLIKLSYKFILLCKLLLKIIYNNILINYFIKKSNLNILTYNIIHNIINIKITSKTTKYGMIKKFSVISIIGNKNGWVGFGISKHNILSKAVKKSYIKSFDNIIYINKKLFNFLCFNLKFKSTKLIIYNYNKKGISSYILNNIFKIFGYYFNTKIIGVSSNIINIINILKKLVKNL